MQFETTITINASPESIWQILTDSSKYTEWDPNMVSIDGNIAPGGKLAIYTELDSKRAFKPTVSEFEENRRMVWSSGMPFGLFKGARTFTLEPLGDGQTQFSMVEQFSGPLLGMIGKSIPDLNPSFEGFAKGLKERAENT